MAEVVGIWIAGGWLMIPLSLLAAVIYFSIFELQLYLARHDFHKTDPDEWGHWIDQPADARSDLGEVIQFTQTGVGSADDIRSRFDEVRANHLPRIESRIHFINILVGLAPLTGLLGTVMGMLTTFLGLSTNTMGNTVDLVAGGISEALITTQSGLVIAIPAYVLVGRLKRSLADLDSFFIRLEVLTILKFGWGHTTSHATTNSSA